MRFRATIRTKAGEREERVIEAASRFSVYDEVGREGGVVTNLREEEYGLRLPPWFSVTFGSGVKRREVIRLAKNLSAMLSAGLSLARALSVIERQSGNKRLGAVMKRVDEMIRQGSAFHEALAAHPKVFSALFVSMARAGEESGSLAESLAVIALQMERAEELSKKVKGAMIYPAIVLTAIVVVAILMLVFVVPTLTATFNALGVKVPLATRVIVAISDFMVAHIVLVLGGLAAAMAGAAAFARSATGSAVIIALALRVPVVGELVCETYAARAARTLASLLAAGVSVLDALAITRETVGARAFARVIEEASALVKRGEPLSAAFAAHPRLYPVQMSDMLGVGEETGSVATMLRQVAEFYEQDVAEKTKDLSTVIEPVLMLLIGGVVGIFAVSMIAPIYSLSSAI